MSLHQVAIVVLNWNGKDDTIACLGSLQKQEDVEIKVIVVDKGSVDDSVFNVIDQFPNAIVIETGVNLGYAAVNNVGITCALDMGFEYIMVLNNDTFYLEAPYGIYFAGARLVVMGVLNILRMVVTMPQSTIYLAIKSGLPAVPFYFEVNHFNS